jgi:hypothetical protein
MPEQLGVFVVDVVLILPNDPYPFYCFAVDQSAENAPTA